MSHTTKTTRLGGAAGYSIHVIGKRKAYTRVELWRDADGEADVLCSVSLSGAERNTVHDLIWDCLPSNIPSDDVAFLTGLVIQAYLDRAI